MPPAHVQFPNQQVLTQAANLIKRHWQAYQRAKQYRKLRDNMLGPRLVSRLHTHLSAASSAPQGTTNVSSIRH